MTPPLVPILGAIVAPATSPVGLAVIVGFIWLISAVVGVGNGVLVGNMVGIGVEDTTGVGVVSDAEGVAD